MAFELTEKFGTIKSNLYWMEREYPFVLYIDRDKKLIRRELSTHEAKQVADQVYDFFVYKNFIFVGKIGNTSSALYDRDSLQKIRDFDFDLNLPALKGQEYYVAPQMRNEKSVMVIYSMVTNDLVKIEPLPDEFNPFVLHRDNRCISFNDKSILCFEIEGSNIVWELSHDNLRSYYNKIGTPLTDQVRITYWNTWSDVLLIRHNSSCFTALHLETGKIIWGKIIDTYVTSPILHEDGIIYHLTTRTSNNRYMKISCETGEILFETSLDEGWNNAMGTGFTRPAIGDHYLAITTQRRLVDSPIHQIVLFDKDSGNIKMQLPLLGAEGAIGEPPRFHGSLLSQLDGEGTLHIFEQKN